MVGLTFTLMHQVTLTSEAADVPPVQASGGQSTTTSGQLDINIDALGWPDI